MRKILAVILAATMIFTVCPAGTVKAAGKEAESSRAAKTKVAKVTNLKAKATVDNGIYEMKYSWKAVKGAKYQYRYKTAYDASYSKKKTVKNTKTSVTFLSYEDLTFQVRAVKTVKGKKQYSAWTTKTLTSEKIDEMFTKVMGLKAGQIRDGIIYHWGLYAEDPANPDCDLMICNFTSGVVMTGEIVYIIYKNGTIDYYGDCERDILELSGGRNAVSLKVPAQGENRPEYTVAYIQEENGGVLITEDGKEVAAKNVDMEEAWELCDITRNGKPRPTPQVLINEEGKPIIRFSWPALKRATEYEVHYTLDYNADWFEYGQGEEKEPEQYETATTKEAYFDIEIPEKHGNIALSVAAKTAQGLREFSNYGWQNSDIIDANVAEEMYRYGAKKVLSDKAKELAAKEEEPTLPICYALYDVDQCGIPFLFYARAYNRLEVEVYRYDYDTKSAVPVKTTKGETSLGGVNALYASDGEFIVCTSDSAFAGGITTYKVTDKGKLKVTSDYHYDYDAKKFTKDGKSITKAAFEKYQDAVWKCTPIELTELEK